MRSFLERSLQTQIDMNLHHDGPTATCLWIAFLFGPVGIASIRYPTRTSHSIRVARNGHRMTRSGIIFKSGAGGIVNLVQ